MEHFWEYTKLLIDTNVQTKEKQLILRLHLDNKETKWSRKVLERCYGEFY